MTTETTTRTPNASPMGIRSTTHMITGEFPPVFGGVSDYSMMLARALADAGHDVHVWTGNQAAAEVFNPGPIAVHRVAGTWSSPDLDRLSIELDRHSGPRRLIAQFVPNAFGKRGMNVEFCRWLRRRRRLGDEVSIVFHEVHYTVAPTDGPKRRFLAWRQGRMVRILTEAADRIYVTIPGWNERLTRHAPASLRPVTGTWLPVPSNIPRVDDPAAVAETRARLAPGASMVLGHFGTYHETLAPIIAEAMSSLLRGHSNRSAILLGRGGDDFAARLLVLHPELAGRVVGTGLLSPRDVSLALQACDLLIQPSPGGICSKQGSTMAGLAQGLAIVATIGANSEPIWKASTAVALVPDGNSRDLIDACEAIITHPEERTRLGRSALELYEREFAVSRTIERLTASRPARQ